MRGAAFACTLLLVFVAGVAVLASAQVPIYYFPVPLNGTGPTSVTWGPDGALWFCGMNTIGRMNLAHTVTEFSIPDACGFIPGSMTTGSDGAIWFTTQTNKVGRITTAGVFTEYSVPTPNAGLGAITAGSDGALWFIEQNANSIASITAQGVFAGPYPVPTPNSGLAGITAGPDGALWFTEQNANYIASISTKGVFNGPYSVPTPNSYPTAITAGPDGALWFTEFIGNIGRMTTEGQTHEFPVQRQGHQDEPQYSIVAGPDGNVWFTDIDFNTGYLYIGQLTPPTGGQPPLPVYTLSTYGNALAGMASGPDGAVWFGVGPSYLVAQAVPSERRNAVDVSPCGANPSCLLPLASALSEFKNAGVQYAVVEAAQKKQYQQTSHDELQAFQNAGFKTAVYCFLYFDTPSYPSGVEQAKTCLDTVGDLLGDVSFVALDVEEALKTYDQTADIQLLDGALYELSTKNVKPVIYTNAHFWNLLMGSTTAFSVHPLWRAGLPESFWGYVDAAGNWNCDHTALSLTPTWHGGDPGGVPTLIPVGFGGWTSTSGVQYDIGQDGTGGACLFGAKVDFDYLSPSLF